MSIRRKMSTRVMIIAAHCTIKYHCHEQNAGLWVEGEKQVLAAESGIPSKS